MNINHHKQYSEESFSTGNKNNLTLTNRSKKDYSITKKFVMKGILFIL